MVINLTVYMVNRSVFIGYVFTEQGHALNGNIVQNHLNIALLNVF